MGGRTRGPLILDTPVLFWAGGGVGLWSTAGVVFAAAAMASLAAAVLMPVGVDMVVMGGVVMCCAQLLELGCGNFYWLNSRAGTGGFGEAGGVTWPCMGDEWVELRTAVWTVTGQSWDGCVGLRGIGGVRSWSGLRGGCGCWA